MKKNYNPIAIFTIATLLMILPVFESFAGDDPPASPSQYSVSYQYDNEYPSEVMATLPTDANSYDASVEAAPLNPSKRFLRSGDDYYHFLGWDKEAASLGDATFTGSWHSISPPEPYSKNLSLRFVDEDGQAIETGFFTDSQRTDNKIPTSRSSSNFWYDEESDELRLSRYSDTDPPSIQEQPNRYWTRDGLDFESSLRVSLTDTGYTSNETNSDPGVYSFKELETPDGYAPLEGEVKARFNISDETIDLMEDATGRAYVDGKTLYIVYLKKQDTQNTDTNKDPDTKDSPRQTSIGQPPAPSRATQVGEGGSPIGRGASYECAEAALTNSSSEEGPAGSSFAPLMLKSTKQGKSSIQLSWKSASNAAKYVVYGNACGKKNKMKKLATLSTNRFSVKKIEKKLKKGTYHKFMVLSLDSNDNVIAASKVVHVATKGSAKAGNPKKIIAKKTKPLKVGKRLKLSAVQRGTFKKHRAVCFETSNADVATVSTKGVVKAAGKGSCYIYAYSQNGLYKKMKITVK